MAREGAIDGGELLDLPAAAERLGVHYQTAYQWVRDGSIPAVRVRGRYRIDPVVLEDFSRRRAAPQPVPDRAHPLHWDQMEERLRDRLLGGDETEARHQVLALRDQGVPAGEIITHLLVPALRAIGDGWVAGTVGIPEEHRATAVVNRLLSELTPNPSGRRRGRVVVAALSGEHHSLPTAMAAAALREDRWNVEHLGSDVPAEEIVRFATASKADVVVLSVTGSEGVEPARRAARRFTAEGLPTIVGHAGATLEELLAAARAHAPAARRRSGHPASGEGS